jgi:hypothetical protein
MAELGGWVDKYSVKICIFAILGLFGNPETKPALTMFYLKIHVILSS